MHAPQEKRCPVGAGQVAKEATENTGIVPLHPVDAKRFATAQARAALVRHTLVRVGDGYLLARYTYSKHCADLDALEAILDRMGAPQ